ncbi:hypothetical protein [Cellulomonas sp.]|uniref:hypothetical protein n=1 Tax=Cellulomonas sp. TaxID=40001 RepID=UPI00258A66B7|nr:hypothetical protein [Cellulomonas sp.]MCR6690131.1 hypothetical protein [Cellulomonas sp.]
MPDTPSLLPRPRPLPRLVRRDDLSSAAWTGMLLDGALTPLWGGVAVTGTPPPSAADRAAALAPLLTRRGVVGREAAAWVHTGAAPPARACVLVPCGVRRPDPAPGRYCAEALLGEDDVALVGGVPVTTVDRTALDVARWLPREVALPALVALVGVGLDLAAARRGLQALRGRAHVRDAHAVVDDACRQVSAPAPRPTAPP